MNIFALDQCPVKSAQYQCDKHTVQMGREAVELLCIAHRRLDGTLQPAVHSITGKPTLEWTLHDARQGWLLRATNRFVNNHHAIWARGNLANYHWLALHAVSIFEEYTFRHPLGRTHAYEALAEWLLWNIPDAIQVGPRWPFRQGVHPDCYQPSNCGVYAHRLNYVRYKSRFARWARGRAAPTWYEPLCALEPQRHNGRSKREIIKLVEDERKQWPSLPVSLIG